MSDWAWVAADGISRPTALSYDEEIEIREKYWQVARGESVVDIGASVGSYTIPALAAGARVYAIDCNSDALEVLEEAARINGFADRLTTFCAALYDGSLFPATLRRHQRKYGLFPPPDAYWTTLDALLDGRRVTRMKIDVEGAELGVLRGGIRLLKRERPHLIIEDHTQVYKWVRRERISGQIVRFLRGMDYRVEKVPYVLPDIVARDYLIATPHA